MPGDVAGEPAEEGHAGEEEHEAADKRDEHAADDQPARDCVSIHISILASYFAKMSF